MRLGKSLTSIAICGFFAPLGWQAWAAWISAGIPAVEIRETSPIAQGGGLALPFFELMSPLPALDQSIALPKLEYKKGPPERYIEKITLLFQQDPRSPKERLTFYGRRTQTKLTGVFAFPDDPTREARYLDTALRLSQNMPTSLGGIRLFLVKPFLLREASRLLQGVETVTIMDQAGTPAFLFESPSDNNGRARASALFVRRNSFYRVDYSADRGFALLDPLNHFRRSFLTEKRADALEYIARNLSEVKLAGDSSKRLKVQEASWPSLLLAAHVSVDPSSVDTFFHFAGLNTLLLKSSAKESREDRPDFEISDTLRNNVLSADAYAKDIAPESPRTREISRFARILTRSLEAE